MVPIPYALYSVVQQAPQHRPASVTVRAGDTLWKLSKQVWGSGNRWSCLYNANRQTIGADPGMIYPGEHLRVPGGCHGPAPVAQPYGRRPQVRNHRRHIVTVSVTGGGVPSGTLSCAGLERLWEVAGGNPADAFMAAEIAMAESGGNQYAVSPTNDVGYWQINGSHGSLATFNALGNAQAAIIISGDGTDWLPWVTYQTGAYAGRC